MICSDSVGVVLGSGRDAVLALFVILAVFAAMRFRTDGYGTVSSALIALPAVPTRDCRAVFRYAEWLPQETPWRTVG